MVKYTVLAIILDGYVYVYLCVYLSFVRANSFFFCGRDFVRL